MASVFCDVNVPDFVQEDCGTELGGIIAVALIASTESPTLANLREASFWTSKLAASPQKYWVISDTRGSYPGGTPVETAGFGRTSTLRTGADHELSFVVRGILANRAFMASVNQTATWNFVWVTNDGIGHYVEDVSIYSKMVVEEDIKTPELWNASVKWSDALENAEVFVAPTAIFG